MSQYVYFDYRKDFGNAISKKSVKHIFWLGLFVYGISAPNGIFKADDWFISKRSIVIISVFPKFYNIFQFVFIFLFFSIIVCIYLYDIKFSNWIRMIYTQIHVTHIWDCNSLFVWVLRHINICRLFNAKSIFIWINCFISSNSV